MSDILYPLSIRNNLIVIAKRDFSIVAINTSGVTLHPMMPLEQLEISTTDDINHITSVKPYPKGKYTAEKRSTDKRELIEVQNAQLALELERTLDPMIRAFPFSEITDVFLPARILADVLKYHSDYDLSELDFPAIAASLVLHADHLVRAGLNKSGIDLPEIAIKMDATSSANSSVPAAKLVMDWLQQMLDGFAATVSKMALSRAKDLRAG